MDKADDAETVTPPPSREESSETPVVKFQTQLPPEYGLFLKENVITEENAQCQHHVLTMRQILLVGCRGLGLLFDKPKPFLFFFLCSEKR